MKYLYIDYFNPNNISINNYAPQVLLTDFKIKNNTVKINSDEGVLKQSIVYTKSVTLSYDRANFSINFSIENCFMLISSSFKKNKNKNRERTILMTLALAARSWSIHKNKTIH